MEYKILLGYLAVVISILSYLFYFWGIWKGKTKPHAFTWFVWGILNAVAFTAIVFSGGKAGSWIFAVNTICCFLISIIGFWQKHVEYDFYDWLALLGAIIGILLWNITHNPLYAVILISLSDAVGLVPTLRKAYKFPFEENLSSWVVGILHYPIGILALDSLILTTWLYPVVIITVDTILVVLIITRRRKLK